MTKDERNKAASELFEPEEHEIDIHLVGIRMRSDADGYYMMLIEADMSANPPKAGRRFTVDVTREAYEAMLDEWVHGPKDER